MKYEEDLPKLKHLRSWLLAALLIMLLIAIVLVWPADPAAGRGFFATIDISPDIRSATFVLLAGALGAALRVGYMLTSPKSGRQQLVKIPFIVVRTVMGAALAFVIWVLIKGGMLSLTVSTAASGGSTANAWTVAGVSVICGLFIEQTMALLNRIANAIFGAKSESDSTADG